MQSSSSSCHYLRGTHVESASLGCLLSGARLATLDGVPVLHQLLIQLPQLPIQTVPHKQGSRTVRFAARNSGKPGREQQYGTYTVKPGSARVPSSREPCRRVRKRRWRSLLLSLTEEPLHVAKILDSCAITDSARGLATAGIRSAATLAWVCTGCFTLPCTQEHRGEAKTDATSVVSQKTTV